VGAGVIVGRGARVIDASLAGVLVVDAWAIPIAAMSPNIVVAPSPAAMIRPPVAGWRRRGRVVRAVAFVGCGVADRAAGT
jgi:hypothetical protein